MHDLLEIYAHIKVISVILVKNPTNQTNKKKKRKINCDKNQII